MWRLVAKIVGILMLSGAWGSSMSAPVTYSFSTSLSPSGTSSIVSLFNSDAVVSGTFTYDSEAPSVGDIGTGISYGGHNPNSGNLASFSDLLGEVSGMNFSDPRGVVIVGNDRPTATANLDSLALSADPSLTSTSVHNFNGFTIGEYSLVNVRLFWLEGQEVPDLISDFLNNETLPAALPAFNGRLALDFIRTGTPTTLAGYVFFDGLIVSATPVSEPETLALLLSGLGSLAFFSRRRRGSLGGV